MQRSTAALLAVHRRDVRRGCVDAALAQTGVAVDRAAFAIRSSPRSAHRCSTGHALTLPAGEWMHGTRAPRQQGRAPSTWDTSAGCSSCSARVSGRNGDDPPRSPRTPSGRRRRPAGATRHRLGRAAGARSQVPASHRRALGIVCVTSITAGPVRIEITPTYSGMPATELIATLVRERLAASACPTSRLVTGLSPPWTTDWMAPEGQSAARGVQHRAAANPPPADRRERHQPAAAPLPAKVVVPYARTLRVESRLDLSRFGSTACKAQYRCDTMPRAVRSLQAHCLGDHPCPGPRFPSRASTRDARIRHHVRRVPSRCATRSATQGSTSALRASWRQRRPPLVLHLLGGRRRRAAHRRSREEPGGVFSTWATESARRDVLDVMPPLGHFSMPLDAQARHYLDSPQAAGSRPPVIVKTAPRGGRPVHAGCAATERPAP